MFNVHRLPSAGNGPRVSTTQEGATTIVRIEAPRSTLAPDELVAFPFGLEARAARALVNDGTLTAAKIGRRLYAKRSEIVALVDKLSAKAVVVAKPTTVEDHYATMVASSGGRR